MAKIKRTSQAINRRRDDRWTDSLVEGGLVRPISSRQNVMVDYKKEKDVEKAIKIYKTGGPEVLIFEDYDPGFPAPDKR